MKDNSGSAKIVFANQLRGLAGSLVREFVIEINLRKI